jgi:hypothetical protein
MFPTSLGISYGWARWNRAQTVQREGDRRLEADLDDDPAIGETGGGDVGVVEAVAQRSILERGVGHMSADALGQGTGGGFKGDANIVEIPPWHRGIEGVVVLTALRREARNAAAALDHDLFGFERP